MTTPRSPLPGSMHAVEISTPGGPDVLRLVSAPLPQLGQGEVLIRVAAAGVNSPDLQQRSGAYPPPQGASPLPGLEVAGEVAALGAGAGRFSLGDRVVALCNGGGYADFVAVPEGQVLPLPARLGFVEGAALPETWFTIQQTLVMRAGLGSGMSVLIHGAAGGIGSAALVISRLYGARPIAVVSSAEKAAYATRLGAIATIDRHHEDFVARVRELTGGKGVDRVVDIVGGRTLAGSIAVAAVEAHILVLATLADPHAEINAGLIVGRRLTLHGSTLRPQPPAVKAAIAESLAEKVWPALADGAIPLPHIRTFDLADAPAAHAALEAPDHFGKTVLVTAFGRARD